ncbi:MAG TPA: hypothetical protein EYQ00_09330 [Dehalococcoidia bacterium]|nr:hypothetical protein [Dehalococcoidia bacterium]
MKTGDMIQVKNDPSGKIWHPYMEKFGFIVEMTVDRENIPTAIAFVNAEVVEFRLDEIEEIK